MVKLGSYGDRYPRQLSGGQQQRIALARAVVFRPSPAADGRAPRRPRQEAPRGAPARDPAHHAPPRGDGHLRHARPGRGARDERSHRHLRCRPDPAARPWRGPLSATRRRCSWPASWASRTSSAATSPPTTRVGRDDPCWSHGDTRAGCRPGWRRRLVDLGSGAEAALVVRPEDMRVAAADACQPGTNAVEAVIGDILYLGPSRRIELTSAAGTPLVVREAGERGQRSAARRPGPPRLAGRTGRGRATPRAARTA